MHSDFQMTVQPAHTVIVGLVAPAVREKRCSQAFCPWLDDEDSSLVSLTPHPSHGSTTKAVTVLSRCLSCDTDGKWRRGLHRGGIGVVQARGAVPNVAGIVAVGHRLFTPLHPPTSRCERRRLGVRTPLNRCASLHHATTTTGVTHSLTTSYMCRHTVSCDLESRAAAQARMSSVGQAHFTKPGGRAKGAPPACELHAHLNFLLDFCVLSLPDRQPLGGIRA